MLRTGSVELRNAVQAAFGVELPATVTFDYPTPAALAGYIAARMAPAGQQVGAGASALLGPAGIPSGGAMRQFQEQGTTTEIVGCAASVASCGDADTSECRL